MWNALSQKLTRYSEKEKELIHAAYLIANEAHKGQHRGTGELYISHPVAVAEELANLNMDANAVAAGLLHDVIEDCGVTKKELGTKVGSEVTFLVESLTKLDRVRYQGIERQVESTRKMFLAFAEDVRVVVIKLADRLHNMRTIRGVKPEKRKRIAQETLELYAPLAYRLGIGEWKGELEDLAFPVAYPEEYKWIQGELKNLLPKQKAHLMKVKAVINVELKKTNISPIAIDYRTKRLYSLWKKLLKYDLDLNRITDIAALRIIVTSVEECYHVLGVIHALWKPLPGKIKDYIAMPKSNGYQSLHTTVFSLKNIVTEIQIRTQEMHTEAELGIAAHWAYSEAGKPKYGTKTQQDRIAWVRKLHDWQKEFTNESSEEFVEALKIDFFKDRIFTLTPKGEVIDLPEGATPIDFAYHIHTEVGDHMTGAKVNGKLVPFSASLMSGDTVEITTTKKQKPKQDWEELARTSLARNHIRSALRKQGLTPRSRGKKEQPQDRLITLIIGRSNRIGLLKDITTILSKDRINILKTEADAENVHAPFLSLEFRVPKKYDIQKLATRIKKIKGIEQIEIKS